MESILEITYLYFQTYHAKTYNEMFRNVYKCSSTFQNEWQEHPQVLHPQVHPTEDDPNKNLPTTRNHTHQTQRLQDCADQEHPCCLACPHPRPLSLHAGSGEISEPTFINRQCWIVQVSVNHSCNQWTVKLYWYNLHWYSHYYFYFINIWWIWQVLVLFLTSWYSIY